MAFPKLPALKSRRRTVGPRPGTPTKPPGHFLQRSGLAQAQVRHVEALVAQTFRIRHEDLRASTRGAACVALARQVAMYHCNTTLGLPLTQVGHFFDRDRTTVGHACRIVEDMRDDVTFNGIMSCLERAILAVPSPSTADCHPSLPSSQPHADVANAPGRMSNG